MPPVVRRSKLDSPDAVRTILAARGLSLAEISRRSRLRFSGNPLFRIPPNFYDALRHTSFSPSFHQLFALSVLTSYRLADWLSVFGFSFDDAAGFQAAWPRQQHVSNQNFVQKEVKTVKYEKPSIVEVANAMEAVQDSLAKVIGPVEVTDLMTVSAYQSDE
jgi:hypothetical protein